MFMPYTLLAPMINIVGANYFVIFRFMERSNPLDFYLIIVLEQHR